MYQNATLLEITCRSSFHLLHLSILYHVATLKDFVSCGLSFEGLISYDLSFNARVPTIYKVDIMLVYLSFKKLLIANSLHENGSIYIFIIIPSLCCWTSLYVVTVLCILF